MLSIDLRAGCYQPSQSQYSYWLHASTLLSVEAYDASISIADDDFIDVIISDLDQLYFDLADSSVSLEEFRAIFSSISSMPFAFLSYAGRYLGLHISL